MSRRSSQSKFSLKRIISRRKRAVSPIIATLILLGITVAAGAVVYVMFNQGISGTTTARIDLEVVSLTNFKDTNNNTKYDQFSVFVQNIERDAAYISSITVINTTSSTQLSSWTMIAEKTEVLGYQAATVAISTSNSTEELQNGDVINIEISGGRSISKTSADKLAEFLNYEVGGLYGGSLDFMPSPLSLVVLEANVGQENVTVSITNNGSTNSTVELELTVPSGIEIVSSYTSRRGRESSATRAPAAKDIKIITVQDGATRNVSWTLRGVIRGTYHPRVYGYVDNVLIFTYAYTFSIAEWRDVLIIIDDSNGMRDGTNGTWSADVWEQAVTDANLIKAALIDKTNGTNNLLIRRLDLINETTTLPLNARYMQNDTVQIAATPTAGKYNLTDYNNVFLVANGPVDDYDTVQALKNAQASGVNVAVMGNDIFWNYGVFDLTPKGSIATVSNEMNGQLLRNYTIISGDALGTQYFGVVTWNNITSSDGWFELYNESAGSDLLGRWELTSDTDYENTYGPFYFSGDTSYGNSLNPPGQVGRTSFSSNGKTGTYRALIDMDWGQQSITFQIQRSNPEIYDDLGWWPNLASGEFALSDDTNTGTFDYLYDYSQIYSDRQLYVKYDPPGNPQDVDYSIRSPGGIEYYYKLRRPFLSNDYAPADPKPPSFESLDPQNYEGTWEVTIDGTITAQIEVIRRGVNQQYTDLSLPPIYLYEDWKSFTGTTLEIPLNATNSYAGGSDGTDSINLQLSAITHTLFYNISSGVLGVSAEATYNGTTLYGESDADRVASFSSTTLGFAGDEDANSFPSITATNGKVFFGISLSRIVIDTVSKETDQATIYQLITNIIGYFG